jgi:hypothetical protein
MDDEEEGRRIQELIELLTGKGSLPSPNGPISNPVDRFAHLPEPTRKFLEELRAEDLDDYRKILRGFRSTSTIVWFFKWFLVTVAGFFVATVAFGENFLKLAAWFSRGGR